MVVLQHDFSEIVSVQITHFFYGLSAIFYIMKCENRRILQQFYLIGNVADFVMHTIAGQFFLFVVFARSLSGPGPAVYFPLKEHSIS